MADDEGSGATKGYKKVNSAGQAKTSAPGTEQANEGKGSATPWAKRKQSSGSEE